MDCIFCKIVNKEIPGEIVYEDSEILAFNDIQPQAPVHILIIPKQHISSLNEIRDNNSAVISKIFEIIPKIAKKMKINDSGYRVVSNCGSDGCQSVEHVHYHLIGGKKLRETLT